MRGWVLAALAVWLGLAGCRSLPPPAPPLTISTPEKVLSRLRARQEQVQAFQGRGRVTLLSPRQNYSGTGLLKGSLPSTLRVDVLDFLGRSLLSFYSDGQQVQVLSLREGKFYRGPATPANLAAFIPPGVTLSQAVRLLLGDLPLSPGAPSRGQYLPARGQYLFEWQQPDGSPRERLWVEARLLQPVKEEWYDSTGRPAFTAELKDFGRLAPDRPGQLKLFTYHPQAELRLVFKELQVNPKLTAAEMPVPRPPDVTEVLLGP